MVETSGTTYKRRHREEGEKRERERERGRDREIQRERGILIEDYVLYSVIISKTWRIPYADTPQQTPIKTNAERHANPIHFIPIPSASPNVIKLIVTQCS
jgi:hypothetical protein